MRSFVSLIVGLVIGVAGTVFFYPFIFKPAPASETVDNLLSKEVVRTVQFIDRSPSDPVHTGKGTAVFFRDGKGAYEVMLNKDFKVGPGPNFHVYLSDRIIRRSGDFRKSNTSHLGKLRSFSGSQVFHIPKDVDIAKTKSLVIWCQTFNVLIVSADF